MCQVILMPDLEDGGCVVEVPSLPACFSQGDSIDEALENIREAIRVHAADTRDNGEEVPPDYP